MELDEHENLGQVLISHQHSEEIRDEQLKTGCSLNEQIILPSVCPFVDKYSTTTLEMSINFDPVNLSTCDKIGPDANIDDFLKYGNKASASIKGLPIFKGERTFFIFYIQNNQDLRFIEIFRYCHGDGSKSKIRFNRFFIDFKDAMSILTKQSRVVMAHGSIHRPLFYAVLFEAKVTGI